MFLPLLVTTVEAVVAVANVAVVTTTLLLSLSLLIFPFGLVSRISLRPLWSMVASD